MCVVLEIYRSDRSGTASLLVLIYAKKDSSLVLGRSGESDEQKKQQ